MMKYSVLIEQRNGEIELRLRELPIIVRARDLATAYEKLRHRLASVLEWAAVMRLVDDLPPPLPMPHLAAEMPVPGDVDDAFDLGDREPS